MEYQTSFKDFSKAFQPIRESLEAIMVFDWLQEFGKVEIIVEQR